MWVWIWVCVYTYVLYWSWIYTPYYHQTYFSKSKIPRYFSFLQNI